MFYLVAQRTTKTVAQEEPTIDVGRLAIVLRLVIKLFRRTCMDERKAEGLIPIIISAPNEAVFAEIVVTDSILGPKRPRRQEQLWQDKADCDFTLAFPIDFTLGIASAIIHRDPVQHPVPQIKAQALLGAGRQGIEYILLDKIIFGIGLRKAQVGPKLGVKVRVAQARPPQTRRGDKVLLNEAADAVAGIQIPKSHVVEVAVALLIGDIVGRSHRNSVVGVERSLETILFLVREIHSALGVVDVRGRVRIHIVRRDNVLGSDTPKDREAEAFAEVIAEFRTIIIDDVSFGERETAQAKIELIRFEGTFISEFTNLHAIVGVESQIRGLELTVVIDLVPEVHNDRVFAGTEIVNFHFELGGEDLLIVGCLSIQRLFKFNGTRVAPQAKLPKHVDRQRIRSDRQGGREKT